MNSINHYIYPIVLRTTITVVVSNKKKKSHFICVAGYVQVYYLITVDQSALFEHWVMLCSNLDGKRLFKSQSCRRNSKKKMKWEKSNERNCFSKVKTETSVEERKRGRRRVESKCDEQTNDLWGSLCLFSTPIKLLFPNRACRSLGHVFTFYLNVVW